MSPEIYFVNESFVVAEKPPGVLSVPSRLGESDARPCLGRELERSLGARVFPVHRLDFEVEGVMLWALTSASHRLACGWFEERRVKKTYLAWAKPEVSVNDSTAPKGRLRIDFNIVRGKRRSFMADHGQPAETWVEFLGMSSQGANAELWRLEPVTGRSHQLRVTMVHLGRPILGDALYGSNLTWHGEGIGLRASSLNFSDIASESRLGLPEKIFSASSELDRFRL